MTTKNYQLDKWDKYELIKEIKKLKKRKRYGIVWDEEKKSDPKTTTREEFEKDAEGKLPILKEVKGKEIQADRNSPTNILIEGDNYHALSVLNYTHAKQVDVIYIDPPYNTGSIVWRYNNRYVDKEDIFKHSKWISFMIKRIRLAKNLLTKHGIFLCSIDDYEHQNLRHILDLVFGEENRLGTITIIHNPGGRQDDEFIATAHEYLLVYARDSKHAKIKHLDVTDKKLKEYNLEDEFGKYKLRDFRRSGSNSRRKDRPKLWYSIYVNEKTLDITTESSKNAIEVLPIDPKGTERVWRWNEKSLMRKKDKYIVAKKNNGKFSFYVKERFSDYKGEKPKTIWNKPAYSAVNGTNELKKIFGEEFVGEKIFEFPKSPHLMKDIIKITTNPSSLILDFFAGSGTTGQAVLELNKEDKGKRRFILVTNNEVGQKNLKELEEKNASKERIENEGICRKICYPRIKKVMKGYSYIGLENTLVYEQKINLTTLQNSDLIFEEIEELKSENNNFDKFTTKFDEHHLRLYGINDISGKTDGLGGNLKYFKTDFVDGEPTDKNKKKLVEQCTEMLCLKEDCFDEIKQTKTYSIFKNHEEKYFGIVYDDDGIEPLKKQIKSTGKKFNVYVFSLDDSAREEEFEDMKEMVDLKPIPEVILNVYKRIFR